VSLGSAFEVAGSSVIARGVTFTASDKAQEYSFNRAVYVDANSSLDAEGCVFDGWRGDTIIYNLNSADGSLILESCDFSGSSATKAVRSPLSDAQIRNGIVTKFTFKNAVADTLDDSLTLVDRALDCSDPNACGDGECVDTALGVLCECLEGGDCLNIGGELSLDVKTRPAVYTFSLDTVSYELVVSALLTGTTYAMWELVVEAGGLDLDVFPASGLLRPGGTVIVSVNGTSMKPYEGGNLTSTFSLKSVGSNNTHFISDGKVEVTSTFYPCPAFEYAEPSDGENGDISCKQCASIEGEEGVTCDIPGATLVLLPIREGYWRSNSESNVVHQCLHSDACMGATIVSSSDDYCKDGYKGPCESQHNRIVLQAWSALWLWP
ncbi:MAG: hypothetical protein ABJP98_09055, partial [Marinobacter alexandrii]|uniref:hypothetical protein n=1 Tax=Marinobacter alexandrii TaxID=2570351 RepID=UPI003298503C